MKTAVAIRHVAFENLGTLAPVLARNGFGVRYVEAADELAGEDPLSPDLLVVLGGPLGAHQERAYPFVADELHLLERRLAAGRPTVGICLGSQLMARALGAPVYPGPAKEIGWGPLALSEAGRRSFLRALAADDAYVLHWHGDTFDLPAGAERLASTRLFENQAFSWGRNALALQFHLEVSSSSLEHWYVGHACEIAMTAGLTVEGLRRDGLKWGPRLEALGPRIFADWLVGHAG